MRRCARLDVAVVWAVNAKHPAVAPMPPGTLCAHAPGSNSATLAHEGACAWVAVSLRSPAMRPRTSGPAAETKPTLLLKPDMPHEPLGLAVVLNEQPRLRTSASLARLRHQRTFRVASA